MTITDQPTPTITLIRNPSLHVIRCNADEIVVRFGTRSKTSHTLADGEHRGILADLIEALALPSALEDIYVRFAGVDRTDVDEVLDQLVEQNVVTTVEAAESGLIHLGLSRGTEGAIAMASVAIVGGGQLADAVRSNLSNLGVNRIFDSFVDDVPALSKETIDTADVDLIEIFDEADLVVVASDHADLALLYRCNSASLETRTPWVMTHADGPELVVGPLFRPGETACFNDYDIQEEAGRTFRMDHLFYKSALHEAGFVSRPLPRMSAEHAAALTSHGIVQALTGSGSYLEGTVVRVDMERLEIIRELVMRLPRCPACSGTAPDYRHPFL